MSAANSEVTVCAFVPSLDADKSVRHAIEVRCALDRIRDRSQIDIWTASLNMLDCGFDIFDFLAVVSPHQKHSNFDATGFTKSDCFLDLFRTDPALHAVEDALLATI